MEITRPARRGLAAAAVAGVAASLLIASPALATSDYCSVSGLSTSCQTYYIPSSYIGHFIDYTVCGGTIGASFRVRDYQNGAVVKSGSIGPANCTSGRVPGLFSSYRLELHATALGADGSIDNV
ncbi:hypothetical protein [Micromonospora arborensis]|uniref:hypothetical protein n=1 Tax=Micromonospora arborensis TaxID=2116518 RepID=UPI0037247619